MMSDLEQLVQLATFAAVFAVLMTGHTVADHVIGQTDRQAAGKGAPTREQIAAGTHRHSGWGACLGHVGAYHLVLAGLLGAAWLVLPLTLSWAGVGAGLGWSAVTHALLDRRWPVRLILQATGSPKFAEMRTAGMNGMYLADQALHTLALAISAVLITRL